MTFYDTSILNDVKKILGFEKEYKVYDLDMLTHINAAFGTLNQLGVGPKETLLITDDTTKWSSFTEDSAIAAVKSYVWTSVRLSFDPPSTSFGIDALQKLQKGLEWRLMVAAERTPYNETTP